MNQKKRFDIFSFTSYIIVAIFVLTTVVIILAIVFGVPWFVSIIEQLVDKL